MRDVLAGSQFTAGLALGGIAAGAVFLLGALARPGRRPGIAGLAFAAAGAAGLAGVFGARDVHALPGGALAGLGLLAAGGTLASGRRASYPVAVVALLPGAALLAWSSPAEPAWLRPFVAATVVVAGPLAADLDRRGSRLGLGPVLWTVTVLGVFATVPDTEDLRVLAGVALPLLLTGRPWPVAALGGGGAAAAIGVLLHAAALGGAGRHGSIVGAAGALGLLVAEPVGRALVGDDVARRVRNDTAATLLLVAGHAAVVAWAARVAGFEDAGVSAAVLLLPGLAAGVAVGAAVGLKSRRRRGSGRARPRSRSRGRPRVSASV